MKPSDPSPLPVRDLFLESLEKPTPAERAAFLDVACRGDDVLRAAVEELLAHHREDSFLEDPASSLPTVISPPSEEAGEMIGPYKLREQIGEGGFGTVWVADQEKPVRRRVALKIIKMGMDTKEVIARFEQERQALALMDHPNIAKVLDAGATDTGRPYFVMELVRGVKITDYCDEQKLSTQERIELFITVCQAVQHAHQKGIIHRDLKPSNILVTVNDGKAVPKVIDFGVAKATQGRLTDQTVYTQFQQMVGTPLYMSPEQAELTSLDIDTRSDIYALGVLLYELLTGYTPIDQDTMARIGMDEMRRMIREVDPPRPSMRVKTLDGAELTTAAKRRHTDAAKLPGTLRGDIDWIVMKCLEKDRKRRYDTANGLALDLQRHLDNEPVTARPSSLLYRFQKMIRRNKVATFAVVGIVTALAVGLGLAMAALVRERAAKERELAQSVRADTVAIFINSLLSDAVPAMVRQGNVRGARELVDTAERLAASSFSNAPAAEINLRIRLRSFFNNRFFDMPAALRQAEAITRLLPKVSDDQLSVPREELLLYPSVTHLWMGNGRAAEEEQAAKALEALAAEFMDRAPPDKSMAMKCQYYVGLWHMTSQRWEQAEKVFAAAYELRPANLESGNGRYKLPAYYAAALSARGQSGRAEAVVRENLKLPQSADFEAREGYLLLVDSQNDALCRQDRFADATRMLAEQRRLLADRGGTEADLFKLEMLRGAVLARSGNTREALPVFSALAADRLSDVLSWHSAIWLAVAAGDRAACQQLCRIGVLRFASTAEGLVAAHLADGLLAAPTDETTLALARGMVERVSDAQDYSKELAPFFSAMLAWREHRPAEALAIMDRSLSDMQISALGPASEKHLSIRTRCSFIRAMLCAELGRADEARGSFTKGREQLTRVLGDTPGRDRGVEWLGTCVGEAMQEEAAAIFKSKGIALPGAAK